MAGVMQEDEKLESNFLDAVQGVTKARNALYEAYNQLFEAYSKMYSAAHNFVNMEAALEVVHEEILNMLTDASLDKVSLDIESVVKYFSVGRTVYKATYSITKEEIGDHAFYDFSRVSCDAVSPDTPEI